MYIYIYIHTHIHTYIYIYIYIHGLLLYGVSIYYISTWSLTVLIVQCPRAILRRGLELRIGFGVDQNIIHWDYEGTSKYVK